MAASKIGDVIARRAKVVVIIVLVLTILFGASASQMQFETEENSFNPDNEVARTQGKISDDFGSEGIITQAVAISNNDNILSRNALLDVLSYEWELENRMVISETLLETPMGSIMGPPDLVFFLMGMLSGAEQSTMALTAANTSIAPGSFTQLATLVEGIEQQIIQLESVMNSTATQTVKQEAQDNFSLALSMQLSALPSLGQESPPPPSGNEISLREQQLMWLDSTTDQEIKDLMIDSAAYDNTDLRNLGNWTSETYLFASIEAASAGEAMTNATLKLEFITTDANYTWSNATSMVGYSQMVTQLREGMNSTSTSFEGLSRTFLRMPDLGDQLTSVSGQLSSLLSKDFTVENGTAKAGLIIIYQDGELPVKDLRRAQQSITDMANDFKGTDVTLRPMAMFIFMDKINDSAQESMITLIPIALLFIIVVLIVNYHSVRDMVLSLMTLLISLVWVFGIAVQLGYEFNIILVAVPVLIGGLGIDYAIHLIMRYREELRKGNNIHKAAATSVMMVGGALALTTITTVIGFMSNTTSSVKPIRDFGSLSALGIICSLVVMLTFIPAIKVISDERRKKKGKAVIGMDELDNGQTVSGRVKGSGNAPVNKFLGASATASEKHPLKVLAVVVIVTSFCAYGSLQLETEFDILDFLPKDLEESKTIIYLMDNFAFSESYAYIYITGDMADDGILNAIDITARQARDGPGIVSNVMPVSPTSVIQDMYRTSPQESGYNQTIVEAIESRDNDGDGIPESDLTNLYDIIRQNDSAWSSLSFVLHYNENGRYD
ncbi:MAG: MMPL family transporter, partial [Thermoplasmata archaeon]|nr:MMPL family transporter [Thermoplasmata archaeon]